MNSIERAKERVHWIAEEASKGDWEGYENRLTELVVDYEMRFEELSRNTPRNTDIAFLIQEMRSGFQLMEKKFEAMDKRFDDLIHQMDKRFDDLIHQMDKRFEQVDKRFDQMDQRFQSIQWFMGIVFSFFAFILTYGTFFK